MSGTAAAAAVAGLTAAAHEQQTGEENRVAGSGTGSPCKQTPIWCSAR